VLSVARCYFDKAGRAPGALVVKIARTGTAARVSRLEARQR